MADPIPDDAEATMLFYDEDGKRTSEANARRQYLSNDPARPDAAAAPEAPDESKAVAGSPNKALGAPPEKK